MNTFKVVRLEDGKYGKRGEIHTASLVSNAVEYNVRNINGHAIESREKFVGIDERSIKAGDRVICVEADSEHEICSIHQVTDYEPGTGIYINGYWVSPRRFRPLYDQPEDAEEDEAADQVARPAPEEEPCQEITEREVKELQDWLLPKEKETDDERRDRLAWKRRGKQYYGFGFNPSPETLDITVRNAMQPQAMWRQ